MWFSWLVKCICPESKCISLGLQCSLYLYFQIGRTQEAKPRGAHLHFSVPVTHLCPLNFPNISMTTDYGLTLFSSIGSEFINPGFMNYHCEEMHQDQADMPCISEITHAWLSGGLGCFVKHRA